MPPVYYKTENLPPNNLDWSQLIPLIGPASMALARFDGVLSAVPNANVLLSPLTTQEAVLSSRIEGTQATMGEVLEYEAEGAVDPERPSERVADIQEVLNYRKAMNRALELMGDLPLCQRIIKEAHATLLDGVRGRGCNPGCYRTTPNWIGAAGCTIEDATFVPIGADKLPEGISRWERFIHDNFADKLIQLAILHAEFEALHPFLDGNGRLGRMFVPLFLFEKEVLSLPVFYVSAFLESHREEYYERLLAISRDGDWTGWCVFFLNAIMRQADENSQKAREILDLHQRVTHDIAGWTNSQHAPAITEFLFNTPIFKASNFTHLPNVSVSTGRRLLSVLNEHEMFRELRAASGRSAAIYAFRELLNIAEGREVF